MTRQINSADFGSGTGGTSISLATNDRGETVIGDFVLGYQHRNLDTAYGSSSSGANFSATLAAVPGDSLWQGLRNTTDTTLSTTPGDFNWVEIELDAGAIPTAYSSIITGSLTVVSAGDLNLTNLLIDGVEPSNTNTFQLIPGTVFQVGARTFTIDEERLVNATAETWVAGDWTDSGSGAFATSIFDPVEHANQWTDLPTDVNIGSTFSVTNMLIPVFYTGTNVNAPLYFVNSAGFFSFYEQTTIVDGVVPAFDGTNGVASGASGPRADTGDITGFRIHTGEEINVVALGGDPNYYQAAGGGNLANNTSHSLASDTNINDIPANGFLYQVNLFTGFLIWDGTVWIPTAELNNNAYYRNTGGRNIDWIYSTTQPVNYTLDEGTETVDLFEV